MTYFVELSLKLLPDLSLGKMYAIDHRDIIRNNYGNTCCMTTWEDETGYRVII